MLNLPFSTSALRTGAPMVPVGCTVEDGSVLVVAGPRVVHGLRGFAGTYTNEGHVLDVVAVAGRLLGSVLLGHGYAGLVYD